MGGWMHLVPRNSKILFVSIPYVLFSMLYPWKTKHMEWKQKLRSHQVLPKRKIINKSMCCFISKTRNEAKEKIRKLKVTSFTNIIIGQNYRLRAMQEFTVAEVSLVFSNCCFGLVRCWIVSFRNEFHC